MFIRLPSNILIKLHIIRLTQNCNLNLLLLEKLQEYKFIYHDNPKTIILMKNQNIMA